MDIKLLIIAGALLVLATLAGRYRRQTIMPLLLAAALALAWTTYFRYEYAGPNWFLFNRVNVFPLVLWTVSLTGLHLIHLNLPRKYRLLAATLAYFVALATIEVIGYHPLNIRLTSNYTSLLGLGIVHAPLTMKIFYVVAGPAYFTILYFLTRHAQRSTKKK
jgi:hypothetical protein